MRAVEVMTTKVITVGENASVAEVAKLLAERGISAVPVVDKDHNENSLSLGDGDQSQRRRDSAPVLCNSSP